MNNIRIGPQSSLKAINFKPPGRNFLCRSLNFLVKHAPVRKKFLSNLILMKKTIPSNSLMPAALNTNFLWAGEEEIDSIISHPEAPNENELQNRLSKGYLLFCMKHKGILVSYCWVGFHNCSLTTNDYEFNFFPLNNNQVFIHDFYTYYQFRGSGHGKLLLINALHALKEKSINEVFSLIEPSNIISFKTHLKLGYIPQQWVYFYGFKNWKKVIMGSKKKSQKLYHWLEQYKP